MALTLILGPHFRSMNATRNMTIFEKKFPNGRWSYRRPGTEEWKPRNQLPPGLYEAHRRATNRACIRQRRSRAQEMRQLRTLPQQQPPAQPTEDLCAVCYDEPRNVSLVPCCNRLGRNCTAEVDNSPFCREFITTAILSELASGRSYTEGRKMYRGDVNKRLPMAGQTVGSQLPSKQRLPPTLSLSIAQLLHAA